MHIKLAGGFRKVQVVFKEGADGGKSLIINGIQSLFLEKLIDKHLADLYRQLVNQSSDSQAVVSENILARVKNLAHFQRSAGLLIGIRKLLQVIAILL